MNEIQRPLIGEDDLGLPYRYSQDFDGIIKERKCTDCFCLLIFIIFLCGMFSLFIISLTQSNYKYIYIPTDSRGLLCGYNNQNLDVENSSDLPDLTHKKYLFWIRPGKPGFSRSFCVEECPKVGFFSSAFKSLDNRLNGFSETDNKICGEYKGQTIFPIIENYSEQKTVKNRFYCPYSTEIMIQRCFPTTEAFDDITDSVNKSEVIRMFGISAKAASYFTQAVKDVYQSYIIILICVVLALFLSILWIMSLRCCAAFFVWLAVILSGASLGVLTWMCYRQWKDEFKNHQLIEKYTFGFVSEALNRKIFFIFFIIMVVLDAIFILLMIFLIDKIIHSIEIIEYVSKTFAKIPSLFFFPIVQYLMLLLWWVYIVGAAIVLFGAGHFERRIVQNSNDPPVDKIEMKYDKLIQGFAIYHFFGFLWVSFFIIALGEMTVSGAIVKYYFTRDKSKKQKFALTQSFRRSLRYHAGSLAFGSLIISIFEVLRMMLEYIDEKTKNSQNSFAKCVVKCCKCCLFCLEKFLKYLNRNAYIMIAIHGYNFCNGAMNAFLLISRNAGHILVVNWVGDFTLFLGRVFVSAGIAAFSLWLFDKNDKVQFYVVPAVITFVMCYFVIGIFASIYEIAIDTVVICYMEDFERNDGATNQRFADQKLKKILEKNENP